MGHQKFYGGEIEKIMQELGWEIPVQSINIKYLPSDEELKTVKESGESSGKYALKEKI
ncbi:hypothetical protein KAW96_01990 [candidate division WOR-3 bacterium]|nr:hypothetical protein [candidate division WOR-3 bacterium]